MPEYEFSEDENEVFETLANRMAKVGLLMIALFVVILINIALEFFYASTLKTTDIIDAIDSILFILTGFTLYGPTDNIQMIVRTEGNDISELMTAFGELNAGLRIVVILLALHFSLRLYTLFFMG